MLLAITAVLWQGKPTPANLPRSHPAYAVLELGAQRNLFTHPTGYSKSILLSRSEVAEILFRAPNPGVLAPSFGYSPTKALQQWLSNHGWNAEETALVRDLYFDIWREMSDAREQAMRERGRAGCPVNMETLRPVYAILPFNASNGFQTLPKGH